MDIFDQYAADPNKEVNGVWVTIGQTKGTSPKPIQLKIARSGNKRHGKIMSGLYETNKSTLEGKDEAAESKSEEILVEAAAKGILLGWKNVTFKKEAFPDAGEEGDTIDAETRLKCARQLLGVKDFRAMVMRHAEDFQKFKAVSDEADAGN